VALRPLQPLGRVRSRPDLSAAPKVAGKRKTTAMMTALVLICSLAKTPLAMDCGTDNAVDVLKVPGSTARSSRASPARRRSSGSRGTHSLLTTT
jgi:hypothetical protein